MKYFNCETCGTLTKNRWGRTTAKFCSHKCANERYKKVYDIERPTVDLSGKTRIIGDNIIINSEYYDWLNQYNWYISDNGYAMTNYYEKKLRMHILIANTPAGMVTDHKNHNRLDNRLSNLRVVTQKENNSNRKDTKGVCFDKNRGKWIARYKNTFYGRYDTEQEAKKVYQLACSGVIYQKQRRKLWHLPSGVSKQFGKYRVCPQLNSKRYWLGAYSTVEEAQKVLTKWKETRG